MSKKIKKILMFNSGGDCSGLNQAMYGVMKRAKQLNIEVYGLYNGDEAFGEENAYCEKLDYDKFDMHFDHSGTILGSRRGGIVELGDEGLDSQFGEVSINEDLLAKFKGNLNKYEIDGIIFTGGDGSMYANKYLAERLIDTPIIAIPKTIDNDTPMTDYSLGFDTACNQVVNAICALEMTSLSHDTAMVVEVMGNSVSHIAINSGVAGCADAILISEIDYSIEDLYNHIQGIRKSYFKKAITIVVSEGVKRLPEDENNDKYKNLSAGHYIMEKLKEHGENMIRCCVLGHIQRGGKASLKDKLKGLEFGTKAVDLLVSGAKNAMVRDCGGKVKQISFDKLFSGEESTTRGVSLDSDIVKTAKDLGIYIGKI